MKTESTVRPEETAVEKCGEIADVILCENIVEEEREDVVMYVYDEYRVSAPYRPGLLASVEQNRAGWLQKAMAEESGPPLPEVQEELQALKAENASLRAALGQQAARLELKLEGTL